MAITSGKCVYLTDNTENLRSNLHQLYASSLFVDMCIACHGWEVFVHKAVMAAASPLLRERIKEFGNCHARINLEHEVSEGDVNVEDLKLLIEFIYKGQVYVPEARLSAFLEVGNHFQVTGLYRQTPNFGNQHSLLPPAITNYNIPQHNLPNTGFGTLPCQENFNFEDPHSLQNEFGSHNYSSLFSSNSFLSPEKLSDSTIKQDKSLSAPVSNATFSDLCTNAPVDSYDLAPDRTIPLNVEDTNPKILCSLQNYTTDVSVQDESDFPSITGNPFQSDFSESGIQVQSEHSKDIFEDRESLSSSGASDPNILFTNLTTSPNNFSVFSSEGLGPAISSGQSCLTEVPFNPCKTPNNSTLPERQQMRLKVKDSIGGVSLQDTSQGEKGTNLRELAPIEEIHVTETTLVNASEDQPDSELILEDSTETIIESQEEEGYACSQCQKCLSSFEDLTHHLYEQHNTGTLHKCLLCPFKTLVENHLAEHGKVHLGSDDRQCCICAKRFKTRATLRNHLIWHASNKWFRCNVCSAHYSQRSNLIKHLASEHRLDIKGAPIKETLKCSACSFETWAPHKLKNHEKRCHTQDKPFKCSKCQYSATERTSLVKHVRIHTKERPYVCDICGLTFVTVSSLKRHCRVHTGEKPYQCMECKQKYADKKRLNDHYLMHNSSKPFKCSFCNYTCRRKDNLQSHIKRSHPTSSIEEVKETEENY